jgi:hypothetical protein
MSIRGRHLGLLLSLLVFWVGNRCQATPPVCSPHPAGPVQRDVVPLALRYRQQLVVAIALPRATPNDLRAPSCAAPPGWRGGQNGPHLLVPPDDRRLYLFMSLQR